MTAVTTVDERTRPTDADGWTVDDLVGLPEDDLQYELVDGCLVVSPPAPNGHNSEAFYLGVQIQPALDREWIIATPGGIEFDVHNWRQPDLLVYRRSARDQKYAGPGDVLLAIEVMSPSSVTRDRVTKPKQYAEFGIPHFWRLERRPQLTLVTHVLDGETYRETGRFDDQVTIDDPVRLRFAIDELRG